MRPTKEQWEDAKQQFDWTGSINLRCDGYLVEIRLLQKKMRLFVGVLVNGSIKREYFWHGHERDRSEIPDIARRFFRIKKQRLPAKKVAEYERLVGKKECKRRGVYDTYLYADSIFLSFGACIKHIQSENASIEILERDSFMAALAAIPEVPDAAQ